MIINNFKANIKMIKIMWKRKVLPHKRQNQIVNSN